MSRIAPDYALALLRAAAPRDLTRAAWKRALGKPRPRLSPITDRERARAASALVYAPLLFTDQPLGAIYRERFPRAFGRMRRRAERILDGEVEIFGRALRIDAPLASADPKWRWERERAGHLVELAAASRLHPALADPARALIRTQLERFLDENPPGEERADTSPLEVAVRAIHWLSAIELAGGARAFAPRFISRLAGALLASGRFLLTHLEDGGVAPANHLLGNWVGLHQLALALDEPGWRELARAGILREAARQVGDDGAHFEASTAYHRFALELLLIAHLGARSAGAPLALGPTLLGMFHFCRGVLAPDGSDPGFGDSDDARLLPIVPRPPRDRAYLVALGAALFRDPSLKRRRAPACEEALWLLGPETVRIYDELPASIEAASASFRQGGVHVLRARGIYVALRSGPYGQHGVGGHAHNDQLALVVHTGGRPLIIDPGTGGYTGDALGRDRFRGTAAHATAVVDGAEQSPMFAGRPFALPERARALPVVIEDRGDRAWMIAAHDGYLRLPGRVRHERRVTLHRAARLLFVEDRFTGRGEAAIELRFPLLDEARLGAGAKLTARLRALAPFVGAIDPARVVEIGGRAALALLEDRPVGPLALRIQDAPYSPSYGTVEPRPLVAWAGRLTLPSTVRVAVVL
ncbi:MAG TPA: alginate lyase family protein [Polyangia bacterium]